MIEITVQNRQRRHKVNLTKIQTMVESLARVVFDCTNKDKPRWIANLDLTNSVALSLIIISPVAIKKLNKQWLGNNKETDVLSFPLLDLSVLGKTKASRQKVKIQHNYENKTALKYELGEIFISYDQAQKQAKQYNHSLERELAFLFVHGLLHILGFDHQNETDEKDMFSRQREILNKVGYLR